MAVTADMVERPGGKARHISHTLPAWTYDNAEFFDLEREHIFMRTWQLVCHVSEVAEPGDYATLDLSGERVFVIRGQDGRLRAFFNVCRHRAHAVVKEQSGHCKNLIRCPYHGWTYDLAGNLKAVPHEKDFPGLDKAQYGLKPLDIEVFLGFVFTRLGGSGPRVAELMAPYRDELELYRIDEVQPIGKNWHEETGVDWKNVMDNFLEGYHIPTGHPGLYRLFGNHYEVETREGGVARAYSWMRDKPSTNWSERHYQKLLPPVEHLPEERRRAWVYYSMFPNLAFDLYPDLISYFQVLPTGPGQSVLRARAYGHPDKRREMRAARYLNMRINTQVYREDVRLTRSVQGGLASRSYSAGVLCAREACVKQFHDGIRAVLPVAGCIEPPEPGSMAGLDSQRAM